MRIHLAGFFWGDCSLSNTLFRRDAGTLAAYLVDAETGELHPQLSDGQRAYDLRSPRRTSPASSWTCEAGRSACPRTSTRSRRRRAAARYEALWWELTREEVFGPDETYRIDERLRRLNDLGFDVEEVELLTRRAAARLRLPPRSSSRGTTAAGC